MWSKFARNSVLLGSLDAYCLICETYLGDEETASLHISKAAHLKTLDSVGYFEKFKNDFIRKIKYNTDSSMLIRRSRMFDRWHSFLLCEACSTEWVPPPCLYLPPNISTRTAVFRLDGKTRSGYFCEVCNALVPTAAQAGLHVAEPRHAERRDRRRLRRVAGGVLARGRLLAEDAWHGLVDDTCVLCNADYDDKRAHRADRAHVLKVLQSKLLFGDDDSAYRKVDSNSYQCLACNIIFSANALNEHFASEEHSTALNKCTVTNDGNDTLGSACELDTEKEKIDEKKRIDVDEKAKHEEKSDKLLNSVADFQKNSIQIDFIHEHAYCKKCSTNVDFDFEAIERHIKDHKAAPKKENAKVILDSGANGHNKHSLFTKPVVMSDAKATATQNDTTASKPQEKKTAMKGNGISNKNNGQKNTKLVLPKQAAKKKVEKVVMSKFCSEMTVVQGLGCRDIILLEKICLDFFSYFLIGKRSFSGVGCLVCNVPLHTEYVLQEHIDTTNHMKLVNESLVIKSLDDEFVREVKTDIFHCGFCNIISDDWDSMEDHLDTPEHKESKTAAQKRLQKHLQEIVVRRQMENAFATAMMGNFMNNMPFNYPTF